MRATEFNKKRAIHEILNGRRTRKSPRDGARSPTRACGFVEGERVATDREGRRAGIACSRWARTGMSALGCMVLLLSGCSSAPSRNILGSYFPSWMICALVGMGATVALRFVLAKLGIDAELPIPIVTYLAFATAVSLGMWLLWLA